MKKIITYVLVAIIFVCACAGIYVLATGIDKIKSSQTKDAEIYKVDELFTHEGITVYRLYDHDSNVYVFFSDGDNIVWSKDKSSILIKKADTKQKRKIE